MSNLKVIKGEKKQEDRELIERLKVQILKLWAKQRRTAAKALILFLFSGCVSNYYPQHQRQVVLVSYTKEKPGKYRLLMVGRNGDTINVRYGCKCNERAFVTGTKYTLRTDSTVFRTVDSRRVYRAELKRNQ